MKKVEEEQHINCEPVCEDCTLDAPTNYEEAYKALKRENACLKMDIDRLQTALSHRNDNVDTLKRKIKHIENTLKLALKTITLISDNIRLLDEALTLTHMNEEVKHE